MRASIASLFLLGATPIAATSCDSALVKEIRKHADPSGFCKTIQQEWPQGSHPPAYVQETIAACACFSTVKTSSSSTRKPCSSVRSSVSSSHSSLGIGSSSTRTSSTLGTLTTSITLSTSTTSTESTSSTITSQSSSQPSSSLPTSATSSTGTITSSASAAAATVVNACENGNFAGYNPYWSGGVADWNITGNVKLVQGYGYTGGGSSDTGAVQMIAGSTPSTVVNRLKTRQDETALIASIYQELDNVDLTQNYTMRFYYTVLDNTEADTCLINAYYGSVLFGSTDYFPVVTNGVAGNTPWVEFVEAAPLTTTDGDLTFQLSCSDGGYAEVFIDQVFVSDQVSPDNMDNISLLYTLTPSSTSSLVSPSTSTSLSTTSDTTVQTTSSGTVTTSSTSSIPTSTSTTSSVQSSTSTSTSTSTSMSTSTSTSALTSTSSTTTTAASGVPTMCVAAATDTTGSTCGKVIYTYSSVYKRINVADITELQCAAACLADSGCESFIWYTSGSTCTQGCVLESLSVGSYSYMTESGSSFPVTSDRNCYTEVPCSEPAEDTVCVDKAGSSPAASCQASFIGTQKSCATPMLSTTVSGLCGSGACLDLCMQYPSCQSYSVTYGGSTACNLYSGPLNEVATASSGATIFGDASCNVCGSNSSVYNYLETLADPSSLPDLSACSVTSTSSTTTSSASSTTSSSIITTSSDIVTTSTLTPTTTTTGATSTSSGCVSCYYATPVPSGSICSAQGDVNYDAYSYSTTQYPGQNSLMECAAICARDSQCKAYGLNVYNVGCAFLQVSLTKAGFTTDTSSNIYWSDITCAVCFSGCTSSVSSASTSTVSSTSTASLSFTDSIIYTSTTTSSVSSSTTSTTSTASGTSTSASACATPTAALSDTLTCGLPGSNGNQATAVQDYVISPAGSLVACAARCLAAPTCLSFEYSSSDTSCYLFTETTAADGLTYTASSTARYYDAGCFSC